MKVMLTGAFGNIGTKTLAELISREHKVRCFDIKTKANIKIARQYGDQIEVVWGDMRSPEDLAAAVHGQEVVVHLAFIIPKLSATGMESEDHPELARAINIGGTQNLIDAMKALTEPPRLLFASSLHVYGKTQDQAPPRTVSDPVHPVEHYAHHKVECEGLVKSSGLEWAIFRLGASMPIRLIMDPGMFDVPLDNRIEYVYSGDVALAIANGLECEKVWGKTWLIGGGLKCQYYYREIVTRVLEATDVGMLPEGAFSRVPFATDWLDTAESQAVLKFQRYTLDDYIVELKKAMGVGRWFVQAFRPLAQRWLLSKSPYYGEAKQ